MIIECGTCNSRFRLDESKITGKGARVRCRKCGEAITVMKDDVDGQAGAGTAGTAPQDEGLDLRSILREAMEAPPEPEAPAAESGGIDALQSDLEKMLAESGKGAEAEAPTSADGPADAGGRAAREPQAAGGPSVDFGPEEEITFLKPDGTGPAADARAETPAPRTEPTPPATPAPPRAPAEATSSEFVMSTADSLDFLKEDYKRGSQKAALDISGSLRVAPAPGGEETKAAPPLGTQSLRAMEPAAAPPSRSEAIQSEIASLGGAAGAGTAGAADVQGWTSAAGAGSAGAADVHGGTSAAGARMAGAAAAPKAPPAASKAPAAAPPPIPPPRAARPAAPARRSPGKKPALKRRQSSQLVRPSVVLLLLLFFALAGGGAYLGFTSDGQKVLRGLVPQVESLWLGGGKPASRYVVANLAGYYEGGAAGRMFVVKGQVTNEGALRRTGVRINAVLLDGQGRKLTEKTAYAGNVFAADALRPANREKIEAAMSNPIGVGLANMDIPPGKSVPFMLVFFEAPDGIDSYRVEARDVD